MPPKKRRRKAQPAPAPAPPPPAPAPTAPLGPLQQLPAELCAMICEWLPQNDLIAAARISRTFRREAQRQIFRTVDIRGNRAPWLWRWCIAINRTTYLAPYVRALYLDLPNPHRFDLSTVPDAERLLRALRKCARVKDYRIAVDWSSGYWDMDRASEWSGGQWLLAEARFRVTTFQNAYLFRGELAKQLWRQPELKILDLPTIQLGEKHELRVLDDSKVLPNLIALGVDGTVPPENLPRSRRLERIQLHLHHVVHLIDHRYLTILARFSASLTTLALVHFNFVRAIIVMPSLAVSLPHLVHLAITDEFEDKFKNSSIQEKWEGMMFAQYEVSAMTILPALRKFDRLETLVLHTYGARPSVFRDYVANRTPPFIPSMRAFALNLMAGNAHLRQVHLGSFDLALAPKVLRAKEIYRLKICEVTFSLLRRIVEGRNVFAGQAGRGFKFDEVSRFWDPYKR
ncbi:F-box domain-containing protein [Mycena chlorophos]|uniref:F-box domain-containing protein n=1 Tax=Mycena chlorophos TaxID=658473 RepID=A0A8H6STR9_MYCCL|nr:F-box domain-containing protein [Mycena chlorophos]